MTYLIDTNIIIFALKDPQREVAKRLALTSPDQIALSAVVEAELYHGAEKSAQVTTNLKVIEDFASRLEVLPYTALVAQHYGAIRSELEKLGMPIGVNDLHIAAQARSQGLVLVTNNVAEFARVPGLLVENWVESLQNPG